MISSASSVLRVGLQFFLLSYLLLSVVNLDALIYQTLLLNVTLILEKFGIVTCCYLWVEVLDFICGEHVGSGVWLELGFRSVKLFFYRFWVVHFRGGYAEISV